MYKIMDRVIVVIVIAWILYRGWQHGWSALPLWIYFLAVLAAFIIVLQALGIKRPGERRAQGAGHKVGAKGQEAQAEKADAAEAAAAETVAAEAVAAETASAQSGEMADNVRPHDSANK